MEDFACVRFSALAGGRMLERDVYTLGSGPVVLVIQELPGIEVETVRFARRLVERGFTVVLPHLVGPLGKNTTNANLLQVICVRREFRIFARGEASPVVDWLKALCRRLRDDHGGNRIGVVGMCLTGNFAISLMADDAVFAAVSSQPSLPILGEDHLHMASEEVVAIRRKLDEVGPMKAYRFEGDRLCSARRFDAIDAAFNDDGGQRIEMNTLPGNGHAVFTHDFVDEAGHPTREALDEVAAYLHAR